MLSKNQLHQIQALHQQKQRKLRQQFIAEGVKTVVEIISQRSTIISVVYALPEFISKHAQLLGSFKVQVIEITEQELKKISLQSTPNQVLAVCNFFEAQLPSPAPKVAFYLDDIRDPGNLGTIIRLSDWFGMHQLFCSHSTCEPYNPKVIQSSMGSFLRVQVNYCELSSLQAQFPQRYGALLEGEDVFACNLQPGLIVIGNEANGITAQNLNLITQAIKIPNAQGSNAESLNAAMAASILAAEFFRQLR